MSKKFLDSLEVTEYVDGNCINKISILNGDMCLKYHQCFIDHDDASTYCPMFHPAVGCLWGKMKEAIEKIDF